MSDEGDLFEKNLRLELPRGRSAKPKTGSLDRGLQARWLPPEEMTGDLWQPEGGLLLGRRTGRLIGWKDDRHVLTMAGSRAGKGVSLIVPNLLLYPGSALVIDPKGENARITAGRRGKGTRTGGPGLGQDVHVIDPFGVSGRHPIASFNPLAELDKRHRVLRARPLVYLSKIILLRYTGCQREWRAKSLFFRLVSRLCSAQRTHSYSTINSKNYASSIMNIFACAYY